MQSNMRNMPEDQSLGDQPAAKGSKVYAATQSQQDQLAEFSATIGAPVPLPHRPADEGLSVSAPVVETVLPEDNKAFRGFEMPEGDYRMMLMLHPERDADGKVGEVPQIQVGTTQQAWTEWVKAAVSHGLLHQKVMAEDGVTELSGFSVSVIPMTGERLRMGFQFSQVAAIIPFRDIDERMLRAELAQKEAKAAAQVKARLAKKRKQQQAASRRKNR